MFLAVEKFLHKADYLHMAEAISENSEKELHNDLDESTDSSVFSSNPMELLDAWRRATAMDDATTPVDALDAAIKAFEDKELKSPSTYE